jgi:large subunit ribosomal protein L2
MIKRKPIKKKKQDQIKQPKKKTADQKVGCQRLAVGLNRRAGRNSQGKITVRHRGGGAKRLYRLVDLARKRSEKATIKQIEKDPFRSSQIALVEYPDGSQSYFLANDQMKKGQVLESGDKVRVAVGNRMKLKNIPPGTEIYNVELKAGQGGKLIRSAGNSGQLKAIEGQQALIVLPSGEIRLTSVECRATVGKLSNPEHFTVKLRKAGQSRYLGRRPRVRGKAKYPAAHPHGGGEGNTSIGLKYPKSPTGRHSLGQKTRKKKYSDKLIVKKRHQ